MGNDPRDGNLPDYAVRQIHVKARKLAGHYGFGLSDQEDIRQELTIEVWRRLPEFNPTKGSLEAFVYWLIKRARATLIERQMAKKRGNNRYMRSLDSPIRGSDGGLTAASEVVDEAEAGRRLGLERQHFTAQSDLHAEFQAFVEHLPADLRELFERMLDNPSLTDISRETGIPRGTLYERRKELRRLMEKDGIQEYHRSSGDSAAHSVDDQ